MATKTWLPNQHTPLHWIYGQHDCCLCKTESKIIELEKQVKLLTRNNKKLFDELEYQVKCSNDPDLHSYANCLIAHDNLVKTLEIKNTIK